MNLDNPEEIKNLDRARVANSIEKLPDQIEQAWKESNALVFPETYRQIKNIIVAGMGGSGLGPELVWHLYKDKLKVPLIVLHDYNLPEFVDENSLVILSSYSGTTEEVLAAAQQAVAKRSKITGITEGKDLGEFLKNRQLPLYEFKAVNNPSEEARLGLGYSVAGILGIFNSLGFIKIEGQEIEDVIFCTRQVNSGFLPAVSTNDNFAKELSAKLQGSTVGVIAAEFLSANAHIFSNQINETSKNFASYFLLSELNHHLLESLSRPEGLGKQLKTVFLESDRYSEKIKKRVRITRDVFEKQGVETLTVKLEGSAPLVQAFESIIVSSWTSFYLALLNSVDPSTIPWVDYFKKEMAKD